MKNEILKKSLKKIVSLLLVLTLIFGTGYSSYAQKTSLHLKTGSYHQLESLSFFVYIEGTYGTAQPGVLEHVTVESIAATKLTMTTKGGSGQFTSTDLELAADPKILHFEIGGFKYYIGKEITNIGKEGGGTMNYEITALPKFEVKYDVNTGTGTVPAPPTNYMAGTTVNVLGNLVTNTKADHVFTGWNTASNGSGTSYVAGNSFVMGFGNVTLYAQWAPLYNVIYNGNGNDGGTAPTDLTEYKSADAATVATKGTLTKANNTFEGWTTASDGSGSVIAPSSQITIANSDVTLYAKWKANIKYTVEYNGNGATSGAAPVGILYYYTGQDVPVLGNDGNTPFVKTENTFIGWSKMADGTSGILTSGATFIMGTSNVILYAQWLPDSPSTTKYTLTYNANGGTVTVPDSIKDLKTNDKPTVMPPSPLGYANYKFMGWNTATGGSGTAYASGSTITIGTRDITLYAQWKPFFVVGYNGNGNTSGTTPNDDTEYFSNDEVQVLNQGTLLKTHYTFGSWNTMPNGSGANYATTFVMGNSDVTLYAKWIPEASYNVLYNTNGATGGSVPVDNLEYFAGDQPVVIGNTGSLTLTGYNFNGWNTVANGSGTAYSASSLLTMGSSDIILYAQWSVALPPTTEIPTTSAPTNDEPQNETTQPLTTPTTATTEATEELTEELIPEGDAMIINFDEPLDSSTFEEVVELETEETPLADALPQTGQLPVELFYGIGGLITAVGVFLKKK